MTGTEETKAYTKRSANSFSGNGQEDRTAVSFYESRPALNFFDINQIYVIPRYTPTIGLVSVPSICSANTGICMFNDYRYRYKSDYIQIICVQIIVNN